MSGRSELSNAEWEEKLRKKEAQYQQSLKQLNQRHIEELKEKDAYYEKKMADLKKKAQEDLQSQEKTLEAQKQK